MINYFCLYQEGQQCNIKCLHFIPSAVNDED